MTTKKTTPSVPEEQVSSAEDQNTTQIEKKEEPIEDTVSEGGEAADIVAEPAVETLIEEVAVVAEPTVEALVEAVAQAAEQKFEEVVEAVEAVAQVAEQKVEEVVEAVEAVAQATEQKVEEVVEATEQKVEEVVEAVEAVAQVAEQKVEEVIEAAEQKIEEVVKAVKAKVAKVTKPKVEKEIQPQDEDEPKESVDFSDEEAELAAEAPEFDLGDESEEEQEQEEKESGVVSGGLELTDKSKGELLDMFAELLASKPVQVIRREVESMKVVFYKLHRNDVDALRKVFVDGGGVLEDFSAPVDSDEERLKHLFGEYRRRRDEFIATLEVSKEENLKVKLRIIEDLKELVNSSETLNSTFNTFRELQQKWRDAGAVPQANVKGLWETYNHHVENFYSFIKINKELRDLDLKRNYEAKVVLCEEADALVLETSVVAAFRKLQKLHDQWREIGPVANEHKDAVWDRFREASSRVNKQHQEHFEGLKDEQRANLELKAALCVKVEELTEGVWTTRKEWNKASDKLLEIQKVWKSIGFAPKRDNAKIYDRFRKACDKFFERKRGFYSQAKVEMEHNMNLKNEICEAAESLATSEDWKKTTDELITLQKRWKEVGPVARKHSDAIWKRFRTACDAFFNNKSKHFSSKDTEYDSNLERKRGLLTEIVESDFVAGGFDMIKEFQRRWSEIGFVPIKLKDAIQKEYKEAMDKAFATLRGSDKGRQMDRFKGKVQGMKESGDRRLRFERDRLYNRVKQLEGDIALLENNIGFFSNSKGAEAMIKDVRMKIDRAKEEMAAAIDKIELIDSQE